MRLSYYSIIVEDHPIRGENLVYNTRTQALVKVDQELRDLLHDLASPRLFAVRVKYASDLVLLHEMGIIVQNRREELKKLSRFFTALKYEYKDPVFSVTILTTTKCNFNCVYCFEECARDNSVMNLATCDAVVAWVRKIAINDGYKQVSLTFYGGEPLLNEEAIEYISDHLGAWCALHGIKFGFLIQTNGYLLTPEKIEKYKNLGLQGVRVSLDGVAERHDRNRPLRGGGGTFDRVMNNIVANVDRVKIGIAVSYDKAGVEHVEHLLDYLKGLDVLHKLGRMVCSPIHGALNTAGSFEGTNNCECMMHYKDADFVKASMDIDRMMKEKGLPQMSGLAISSCSMMRRHGGVTIDPQGNLFACNAMAGHPEFSVGNIGKDNFFDGKSRLLKEDSGSHCPLNCAYLPICNGGCRLMSVLEKGSLESPHCRKQYLDQIAPEMIKRQYDESISRQQESLRRS